MGLSAGMRLGPYEILGPLGAGGMGEVYRARDTRLGREVAVKVLPDSVSQDPHRATRFETEARALAALSHPGILDIHDFGQSDGRIYVVTELLDGGTLRDRMTGDSLAWRKAAEIAAAIADGLASAHAAGIVHRDLKPENVFLTTDGRVKILDFGLAKVMEVVSEDAVTVTSPSGGAVSVDGQVVGTLSFMAPEQLRGRLVDGRTDIFALGCVLFEMLSGKRPFAGETPADTISAALHAEPRALDSAAIPPALKRIVFRCLEKHPEDRFHTAHDLALALRSISTEELPAARPTESPLPFRRARRAATLIVGAAVAAVAMFLVWRSTSRAHAIWEPPRQITSTRGWDGDPALSPDGTLVAYSSNAVGNAEIFVIDPEGGEPLRVTDDPADDRRPAWFPDGRSLAFSSNRNGQVSIWRIPRLGGSANLLVENADMPAISPDGTRIAFSRRGPSGFPRIWEAPLADPSRAVQLSGDEDGEWAHSDPAWSPDGKLLCYASFRNLWLVRPDAGKPWSLTPDGRVDREPVFSPDGHSVLFSSLRRDPQSLWRVSTGGGPAEQILPGTVAAGHPSLSRDGRRLVYSIVDQDVDVIVADRRTGDVHRIASSRIDESPAIAPDGSAVAYCSNRSGTYDLWLEALEEGRPGKKPPLRLTSFVPGGATPAFSPDGRWIALFRPFKGHRDLWVVPLSGGTPWALVEGPGNSVEPSFAPDGMRLAFISDRAGPENVWVVPIRDGHTDGEPWRLTEGGVMDSSPTWSPDGKQIAFLRGLEVWLIEVRPSATPRRVTTGAEAGHLAWEPDGSALLVAGTFGLNALQLRRVETVSGTSSPVTPHLVLGNREADSYVSLTRDGRFFATQAIEIKGNLWSSVASGDRR